MEEVEKENLNIPCGMVGLSRDYVTGLKIL
jgi:hypothetical protein